MTPDHQDPSDEGTADNMQAEASCLLQADADDNHRVQERAGSAGASHPIRVDE